MKIMQKEMEHTKRLKQMRDKENADTESRRRARDARMQSARVKKYYDDYVVHMKSGMLRNKTKEEQVLGNSQSAVKILLVHYYYYSYFIIISNVIFLTAVQEAVC